MSEHEWVPVEGTGDIKAKECPKCQTGAVSVAGGEWEYYRNAMWMGFEEPSCPSPPNP